MRPGGHDVKICFMFLQEASDTRCEEGKNRKMADEEVNEGILSASEAGN